MDSNKERIVNLDFLRAIFLIFALDEHFTYFVNRWFIDYFHYEKLGFLTDTFVNQVGKPIATDSWNYMLGIVFIPWVSQIYITMASFNLARYDQETLKLNLRNNLKKYLFIFFLFLIENFIVSPDIGQALSLYPIMTWMILLSLINIIYSYFGNKGIIGLLIISVVGIISPTNFGDLLELKLQTLIHPNFEYDARINYFLTSCVIGFLMGKLNTETTKDKYLNWLIILSFGFLFVWYVFGDAVVLTPTDAFHREHDWAKTWHGMFLIVGSQILVLSTFLKMHFKNIRISIPIFNWISQQSLWIFLLHRILFIYIVMPISIYIHSVVKMEVTASIVEMYLYVFFVLVLSWMILKGFQRTKGE